MNVTKYFRYLVLGVFFGFVLVKSEVVSWFRIQEMFRFDSIHMYGVIGLAVLTGFISIRIIRHFNIRDIDGDEIIIEPKDASRKTEYIAGGTIFGLGWALLGACPGPMFALLGSGLIIFLIPILSAMAGTYVYAMVKDKLPR